MGDVDKNGRQRYRQLNDQSQSLINPCMSTLTVIHIFNKRPVVENESQFRLKSIKYSVLVITISPQHSAIHKYTHTGYIFL